VEAHGVSPFLSIRPSKLKSPPPRFDTTGHWRTVHDRSDSLQNCMRWLTHNQRLVIGTGGTHSQLSVRFFQFEPSSMIRYCWRTVHDRSDSVSPVSLRNCTVQYSTVQYSTVQYSTDSTVQYSTVRLPVCVWLTTNNSLMVRTITSITHGTRMLWMFRMLRFAPSRSFRNSAGTSGPELMT
jgi:hypothetical protein